MIEKYHNSKYNNSGKLNWESCNYSHLNTGISLEASLSIPSNICDRIRDTIEATYSEFKFKTLPLIQLDYSD